MKFHYVLMFHFPSNPFLDCKFFQPASFHKIWMVHYTFQGSKETIFKLRHISVLVDFLFLQAVRTLLR